MSQSGEAGSPVSGPLAQWPRVLFACILLVHAAVGLYFLQFHRYNLNPDAISYISIAQKYRAGNFADAINGYWSPLFSWLLAPFLSSSWSPVLAAKLVALAASLALVVGARALSYRFAMAEPLRAALLLSLAPVGVYMALRDRTPDLLIVAILLLYLSLILDDRYRRTNRGWGCGVLGSLGFLAKSFGLPFFLVHFVAFNVLHYWRGETSLERRQVMRNCLSGLVVFAVISGVWVAALSAKYGGLTVATAGRFNFDLSSAGYPHSSRLLPPPNPSAVSYWEDPYLVVRDLEARIGTSIAAEPRSSVSVRATFALRRLGESVRTLQSFSVFSMAVLLGAAWLARPRAPAGPSRDRARDVLVTLGLYCGGYILLVIEPRYLWVVWPLVMIVGFHLASSVLASGKTTMVKAPVALLLIAFVASCWVEPWSFLHGAKEPAGRNPEQVRRNLERMGVRGRVASDTEWGTTMGMAFHNQWQYYGYTGHGEDGRDVRRELEEHGIDYYIVWSPEFEVGADWKDVTLGRGRRPRIFSVKERP